MKVHAHTYRIPLNTEDPLKVLEEMINHQCALGWVPWHMNGAVIGNEESVRVWFRSKDE